MGFAFSLNFRRIYSKNAPIFSHSFSIFPKLLSDRGENPRPKIPTRFLSAAISYNLDLGGFIFVCVLYFFRFYHSLWRLFYCEGKSTDSEPRSINTTHKSAKEMIGEFFDIRTILWPVQFWFGVIRKMLVLFSTNFFLIWSFYLTLPKHDYWTNVSHIIGKSQKADR